MKMINRKIFITREKYSDTQIHLVEMASSEDVRDIMGLPAVDNTLTKDLILGTDKKK